MNLNVRRGQMILALIAQTVIHRLRTRMGEPYRTWDANHSAGALFFALEGDVRVQDNAILVAFDNAPNADKLRAYSENPPHKPEQDSNSPTIPRLYGRKLDFRFRQPQRVQ